MLKDLGSRERPQASRTGRKAFELMGLRADGFAVPDGFVLETGFFEPWVERMTRAPEWDQLLAGDEAQAAASLAALRRRCADLTLDEARRGMLRDALSGLRPVGSGPLYAVRSSSPEEDLAHASFAGAYESVLAVPAQKVEAAARDCFASCFSERVHRYRARSGLGLAQK